MYEREYGYKYQNVSKYAGAAEIAKAIRADIKEAKIEGLLPKNWKYSVRSHNYSGGCSIDVTVDGPREEIIIEEDRSKCAVHGVSRESLCGTYGHYSRNCEGALRLTELAESTEMTLKRIHNAYNHDGSEIMVDYFDVRYYGQVQFAWHLLSKPKVQTA